MVRILAIAAVVFGFVLILLGVAVAGANENKAVSTASMKGCLDVTKKHAFNIKDFTATKISALSTVDQEALLGAKGDLAVLYGQYATPLKVSVVLEYRVDGRQAIAHCVYSAYRMNSSQEYGPITLKSAFIDMRNVGEFDVIDTPPIRIGALEKLSSYLPIDAAEVNHFVGMKASSDS